MNHIYRLIWNEATATFVAVAENTCGRGKGRAKARTKAAARLVAAALATASVCAFAAPTGGSVSAGTGTIAQSGATTTVTQTTQNLAVNWQSFNVGAAEMVNFVQPNSSAIALNRVLGTDGSSILGKLNANGQVWILNPNGVLFGQGAQVNVGGLVASTLGISDADFLAGKRTFSGAGGSVINQSNIAANYVALLGEQVKNEGAIVAQLGAVALAAGNQVTLDFVGDKLLGVQVDAGALHSLAENKALIQADGGMVVMTAKAKDALLDTAVNNTGVIQARTIENRNGVIKLLGDMQSGTVNVGGTLDVSAPAQNTVRPEPFDIAQDRLVEGQGNGGFIETSAAHVKVADNAKITTAAAHGLTGSWLIDPVDFTIAAGSGALTTSGIGATTLSNALGGSNVAIATSAATGGNGDIFVNAPVTWSANTLSLAAHRNINVNANLNGSGTASLALEYGQGAVAAGNTSNYTLSNGAKVYLPAGANFSTKLGSNGAITPWTVITGLGVQGDATVAPATMTLQGMNTGLAGNYVLGADIDASGTSSWNANAGFTAVGNGTTKFTGNFDGLGHTVTGLTINRTANVVANDYQGLFGYATGALRNVGMLNSSISGLSVVGTLAGRSDGAISYAYADGGSVNVAQHQGGGLIGQVGGGSISNSYANVSVTGLNAGVSSSDLGGLVGLMAIGSTGISNSYATGSVNAGTYSGSLVGQNRANITNSYATGAVGCTSPSPNACGGLIGDPIAGTITSSYWDSATTGRGGGTRWGNVAGLTDITAAPKAQASYAGFDFAGSWRIYEGQTRPLLKSFLTPLTVTANASKTYDGLAFSGGNGVTYSTAPNANLLGTPNYGGSSQGAINVGSYVITPSGLYSNQRGYDISYTDGTLTVNKAHLTVTADNASRAYGAANPTLTATISGFVNGETLGSSGVSGSATLSTTATSTTGAGTVPISVAQGSLAASNYDFTTFTSGTLTINKAHLTVAADNASRTYGAANPTFTATLSGFVNGETLATSGVSGSAALSTLATASTGVGSAAIDAAQGTLAAANYDFTTFTAGTLTINKAHLTVAADNLSRTYGAANPTLTATISGFVNGENLATSGVSGSAALSTAATAATAVSTTPITVAQGSLAASNYDFTAFTPGTLTINKAHLTVAADNASRTYGAANPTLTATLSGFVNGENLATSGVSGSAALSTAATATTGAGTAPIAVAQGSLAASNYDFTTLTAGTLTIAKAPLTVTANSGTLTYNGLAQSVSGFTATGLVNGETTTVLTGVTASGSGTNAGTYATTASGTDANYNLTFVPGTLTITKAPLSVTGSFTAASKFYDGTTTASISNNSLSLSGLQGSDVVAPNWVASFADPNPGIGKTINLSSSTFGAAAGNYSIALGTAPTATASIWRTIPTVPGAPVNGYLAALNAVLHFVGGVPNNSLIPAKTSSDGNGSHGNSSQQKAVIAFSEKAGTAVPGLPNFFIQLGGVHLPLTSSSDDN